jgi:prolyl-tRNA synthetase
LGKKTEGDLFEFKELGKETQNLSIDKIVEIVTKQKVSN